MYRIDNHSKPAGQVDHKHKLCKHTRQIRSVLQFQWKLFLMKWNADSKVDKTYFSHCWTELIWTCIALTSLNLLALLTYWRHIEGDPMDNKVWAGLPNYWKYTQCLQSPSFVLFFNQELIQLTYCLPTMPHRVKPIWISVLLPACQMYS